MVGNAERPSGRPRQNSMRSRARKYQRTEDRKDPRAGSYHRRLQTKAGRPRDAEGAEAEVPAVRYGAHRTLSAPEVVDGGSPDDRDVPDCCEGARVEDITQALWGTPGSFSTGSDLNQMIYGNIDEWRERHLVGDFPITST